jgi:hypothetical protein
VGQRAYSALPKNGGYQDALERIWFPRGDLEQTPEAREMIFDFKLPIKVRQQGVGLPENGEVVDLIPRERGLPAISGTVDTTSIGPRSATGTVTLLNVHNT